MQLMKIVRTAYRSSFNDNIWESGVLCQPGEILLDQHSILYVWKKSNVVQP